MCSVTDTGSKMCILCSVQLKIAMDPVDLEENWSWKIQRIYKLLGPLGKKKNTCHMLSFAVPTQKKTNSSQLGITTFPAKK